MCFLFLFFGRWCLFWSDAHDERCFGVVDLIIHFFPYFLLVFSPLFSVSPCMLCVFGTESNPSLSVFSFFFPRALLAQFLLAVGFGVGGGVLHGCGGGGVF